MTRKTKETWKLGTADKDSGWEKEGETVGNSLGEIALVVGNNIYDLPVLENLAELNILHYGKMSDKDNNISISMSPFLHFGGFDKDDTQAVVSVHEAYINSDTNSFVKWVQNNGEGITVAIDDLTRLEGRMKASGSAIITTLGSGKTATETNKDNNDEMSSLQSIVVDVEQSAQKMMTLMSKWLGKPDPKLTLEIFKEFSIEGNELEELKHLQRDRMSGDISQETYLNELKSSKILKNQDFDVQAEIEKTAVIDFSEEEEN